MEAASMKDLTDSFIQVPVFRPSEAEFCEGPFKYIYKLSTSYPELPMLLIEPHAVFQPDEVLDQDSLIFETEKFNFLEKKVQSSGRQFTFREYCNIGDDFKRDFFMRPPDMVATEEIEEAFWSLVSRKEDIEILKGSSLPLEAYRPKFIPRKWHEEEKTKEWNFSEIKTSEENMLHYTDPNAKEKISTTLDIGMCFTHHNWRRELHWCLSLNYLHYGDSKIWYAVSPVSSTNFPVGIDFKDIDLSYSKSKSSLLPGAAIVDADTKIYRAEQQAGQFLIVMPRATFTSLDVGVNMTESLPIAPAFWLNFGRSAIEFLKKISIEPFFNHDEMVMRIACEAADLEIYIAEYVLADLKGIRNTFLAVREKNQTRERAKQALELLPTDDRRCEVCKTILFLFTMACDCPGRYTCLNHAKDSCSTCEKSMLRYRYDLEEFDSLLSTLQARVDDYRDWQSAVNDLLKAAGKKYSSSKIFDLIRCGHDRMYPENSDLFIQLKKLNNEYKQLIEIVHSLYEQQKKYDDESERRSRAETAIPSSSLISARIKKKLESEKEATAIFPLKTKNPKTTVVESDSCDHRLSFEEFSNLYEELEGNQIIFPHMEWLADKIAKCNRIKQNINKFKTSREEHLDTLTSETLEKLVEEANGISFIDFSEELEYVKNKLDEIKWLEECELLLNDSGFSGREKLYDLVTLKEMIDNGVTLKSSSREIINSLNRLHKIHGDASKWINNTKGLLNIVKNADHYWDEDASKPTIGELAALAEEIRENPGLRKVDLSPYSLELKELLSNCRTWMNKVSVVMNSLRSNGRNEEDVAFASTLEEIFNEGKGLGCQLKDLSRIKNTLETAHAWREQLYKAFMRKNALYNLVNVLTPLTNSLLPASVDLMNTSARCYYQQLKKQSSQISCKEGSKKVSRFERLLNGDYSRQKIRQIYQTAEKDEGLEIGVLRRKRMVKNNEIASYGSGTRESSPSNERSSKEREKHLKKFCFCGKPIAEWMVQCQLCQEWFHINCVQSHLPLSLSISKGRKQASLINTEEIRDQFCFLCPLCCRGNRPPLEILLRLFNSYSNLPVRILEGELFICLIKRVERYREKLMNQINQKLDLLKGYNMAEANSVEFSQGETTYRGSPSKNKRKSPLILRGELSEAPSFPLSSESKMLLWDLICEGNLLEVSLPEVHNIWTTWILANPHIRTVVFIDSSPQTLSFLASPDPDVCLKEMTREEMDTIECESKDTELKGRFKRKRKDRGVFERTAKRRGRKTKADKEKEVDDEICSMEKDCKRPEGKVDWICCDGSCQGWFHQLCAGISSQEVTNLEQFFCHSCRESKKMSTSVEEFLDDESKFEANAEEETEADREDEDWYEDGNRTCMEQKTRESIDCIEASVKLGSDEQEAEQSIDKITSAVELDESELNSNSEVLPKESLKIEPEEIVHDKDDESHISENPVELGDASEIESLPNKSLKSESDDLHPT